ncbi:MAG: hypothetical protein ACLPV8_25130 [Steroidobacteraceae bacterium]
MQRSAFSHARLMRVSTDRIASAWRSNDAKEHLLAQRILATPESWQSWELEHSGLMRVVADCAVLRHQAAVLRQTSLRLIHGTALFEYLKNNRVRGAQRVSVLLHFHPTQSYQHAVIAEHAAYLRKACSFLCASHVGSDLVQDAAFLDPMQEYERLYAEYFELYCSTLCPREGVDARSEQALLPLLKHQLDEWRWVILNPKQALPHLRRESELRQPTGDTQRTRLF